MKYLLRVPPPLADPARAAHARDRCGEHDQNGASDPERFRISLHMFSQIRNSNNIAKYYLTVRAIK
ncbi:MAG: hypothetical protein WCE94_09100 [Candidatus Methanoperedens sp.]